MTVDQKQNVTNDCKQDSNNTLLCATINSALRNLKYDSTVIYIRPGNYTLRNGEETDITGKQDIAIIGSGEDSIITCTEYTGLGVLYSVNITIEYIVMKGCGRKHEVIIDNLHETVNMYVALYFENYKKIILDSVVIQESKALGVYIGNTSEYSEYFQNYFIMKNCSIVNRSVAESSQNSIAGGILINIQTWGTVHLNNTNITNNGGGTQSHNIYCFPIDVIAGIAVMETPSAEVNIDSCMITNNNRGLVVYAGSNNIHISKTVLFNHFDSLVVFQDLSKDYDYHYWPVYISLRGVTINNLSIIASNSFPPLNFHYSHDGNFASNEFLNISIGCDCDYSLKLIENDFSKCYSQPGTCSNDGEDYSRHCPPSYSQCEYNYCSCSEGRNGTLCGQCIHGNSV